MNALATAPSHELDVFLNRVARDMGIDPSAVRNAETAHHERTFTMAARSVRGRLDGGSYVMVPTRTAKDFFSTQLRTGPGE